MTGEGLQILTYARHLWSLSSEGSLACHTYRKTGHLRGPLTLIPTADRLAVLMTQVCYGWDSYTQPSACGANPIYLLRHRRGLFDCRRHHCCQNAAKFIEICWCLCLPIWLKYALNPPCSKAVHSAEQRSKCGSYMYSPAVMTSSYECNMFKRNNSQCAVQSINESIDQSKKIAFEQGISVPHLL